MTDVMDEPEKAAGEKPENDREQNRFGGRVKRYGQVSTGVGGVAAKIAMGRLLGRDVTDARYAEELTKALGGLKGPIMKVAQLMSTIPDALPADYAEELSQLQSHAPPMGWPFVKRRMAAELGRDWKSKFASFEREAINSASLGQVHQAVSHDGQTLACKLQYPDMQSAVEADLNQLNMLMGIHRRFDKAIDTTEISGEIGERLREELDYGREAAHLKLYRDIFDGDDLIRIPAVHDALSTERLLTMTWLKGNRLLDYKSKPLEERNQIARAMFRAWWHPFNTYGVIHGDPHLGNYTVWDTDDGVAGGLNLLDFGCMRTFPPKFVESVHQLYFGILHDDRERTVDAYEMWGFSNLKHEVIDILSIWAKFIFGPLLDDRERTIADGVAVGEYGRKQAFQVHQELKEKGPVTIPREFVFMDRAAIGTGGVYLHLDAKLNFYRMFNETIEDFNVNELAVRQTDAFTKAGVPMPTTNNPRLMS